MRYLFYACLLFTQVACGQTSKSNHKKASKVQIRATKNDTSKFRYSEEKYVEFGIKYIDMGAYNKALEMLGKAIQVNPNYLDAYLERATCYRKMSQFNKAISDLKLVLRKDVNNPLAFNNLANVFFSKQDYVSSIKYHTKAIRANSNFAGAYYNRGIVYHKMGKKDKACIDWKKADELGDQDAKLKLKVYCQDK